MNDQTHAALKAAIDHFERAANQSGDAAYAINVTATGLVCLTGLLGDLIEEVDALRSEVEALGKHE